MPTERDFRVLHIVAQRIQIDGFPPSLKEICAELGAPSDNTARKCLIRLEQAGYISRRPKAVRAIKLLKPGPGSAAA
jgi:repressor LexA